MESKIIVSKHEDSNYINKLKFKKRYKSFSSNNWGIVLCPTLACNFACPYCYEKDLPNHTMSETVQEQLIDFINNHADRCKSMTLNWHGGEPLIAFKTIRQIYESKRNIRRE